MQNKSGIMKRGGCHASFPPRRSVKYSLLLRKIHVSWTKNQSIVDEIEITSMFSILDTDLCLQVGWKKNVWQHNQNWNYDLIVS